MLSMSSNGKILKIRKLIGLRITCRRKSSTSLRTGWKALLAWNEDSGSEELRAPLAVILGSSRNDRLLVVAMISTKFELPKMLSAKQGTSIEMSKTSLPRFGTKVCAVTPNQTKCQLRIE